MLDILGKRYYFFLLSFLIIIPGLIILAVNGLPIAIDFKGGSYLELQFPTTALPSTEQVLQIYESLGVNDAQVQTANDTTGQQTILIIKSDFMDETTKNSVIDQLKTDSGTNDIVINNFQSVGPTIAQEVTNRALLAVAIASIGVILYITYAFRGVAHAFRYGVCAIAAMIHDILIVFAVLGYGTIISGWQMDSLFLTALLTVIGFSTSGYHRGIRPHPRKQFFSAQTAVRETGQPFHRSDLAALHQHPVDDFRVHAAGPGPVWWCHPA